MARAVRNPSTHSRSARLKLAPQTEPYWTRLRKGCYVGYRKAAQGGTWIARFRDASGQQHYQALGAADDAMDANGVTCLSFDQAQEKAREWVATTEGLGPEERTRGAYTVAACFADYLAWVRRHRKSARHIETYGKAYILPKLGRIDTTRLTLPLLRKWHREIAEEPPRLRTRKGQAQKHRTETADPKEAERKRKLRANRQLVILRAALNHGWREGKIARTDAWARVRPFPGTERPRSRFLTHAEARRLLNACPPELRALVRLALLTGARFGELCAFDVGDFQPDVGALFVRDSKSGKPRHIILNDEGRRVCAALAAGRPPDAPLLVKADGTRWARDHQFRPFKAAVQRAGLAPDFTFHELRHTWASLTLMAGAPLLVVAQNLGHRDTRMVERHYGHLADTYVRDMIRQTAPSYGDIESTNVVSLAP